jgi:hypothetical protein
MKTFAAAALFLFISLCAIDASAEMTPAERAILNRLDVSRTLEQIRHLSENVVKNDSGVGAGSAVAGSADEKALADYVEQQLRSLGLQTRQELFPVRHYEYGRVTLTAAGKAIDAVSLHAAGGTWGSRDGVPYARGNDGVDRHRVRAALVDAGNGFAPDYEKAGPVTGKVVLVRRTGGWPTYQIIEAARRGAVALLMYDYPGGREDTLKQDSMWYHEQLPLASIRKADAIRLQAELGRGSVEIVLENRIDVQDGQSSNVIATVAGSEFPDEWITVSAHHDRWFTAAVDDCSGVASMIELARLFTTGGYRPRRSMMFISFGAEEAGIEATESDWLAGSDAFIRQHPEITRRLALGVNIDVSGWGGPRGNYLTTPDGVPFGQAVVNDLGEADKTTVLPIPTSTTDAWNLASVGGGTVAMVQRTNESNGGVFGGGSSYSAIYHTDLDIFDPTHFPNLGADLRLEALSIVRTDQAVALPIDFGALATWVDTALTADKARVQGVSFGDVEAALEKFRAAWTKVEQSRPTLRSKAQAGPANLWLMRTRKDVMPWLMARGGGGVRTSTFASQAQTFAAAKAAAEKGDAAAALQAIERLAGASPRVSREAYADQRLYAYTSGDWSVQFGHRPRPLPMSIYDIYQRLKAGGDAKSEAAAIGQLEAEARANLTDALFLMTGKLNLAAQALGETPLP